MLLRCIVALLLLAATAAPAGAVVALTNHGTSSSVGAANLTMGITASAGDLVVVSVNAGKFNQPTDPFQTLAISGCGLTWTNRGLVQYTSTLSFTEPVVQYLWYAPTVGALTGCTVTVTPGNLNGHNLDGMGAVYGSFSGTFTGTPYDANGGLPNTAFSVPSAAISATINTSNTTDLAYFFCSRVNTHCGTTCPAGWTLIDFTLGNGNVFFWGLTACYKSLSVATTGLTTGSGISASNWAMISDALTSVAAPVTGHSRLIE